MKSYLFLLPAILKFWYYEAPIGIYGFFKSLNGAFFQIFALPLFIKTLFKPLKNEYRQGLVGFSRTMGIIIKSFLIFIDLIIFIPLLCFEAIVLISFLAFPVMTVWILVL